MIEAQTLSADGAAARSDKFLLAAGVIGAWILAGICMFLMNSTPLADRLGDTDDALRLVVVRDYLAGSSWFDLHLDRLQPPAGYDSHWSRLIDAGLAGLYLAAKPLVGHEQAEIAMRIVWPWLWLLPSIAGVASMALRLGGRNAFWATLAFSTSALLAFQQFIPGRIDHHNVQIALALAAAGALVWADTSFRAAVLAGAITGFMPAIGLENIHYLVLALAMVSLLYVCKPDCARHAAGFWLALMLGAAAAFLISIPPAQWATTQCDGIAINLIAPLEAAAAVFLLGMAALKQGRGAPARLGVAATAGAVFVSGYLFMDPACIRGPFALVDPAIKFLWLDHVGEAVSLKEMAARGEWPMPLAVVFNPAMALAAGCILLAARRGQDAAFARWIAVVYLAVAIAIASMLVRMSSYAAWFAMPLAAAGIVALWDRYAIDPGWKRILSAAAFAPLTALAFCLAGLPSVFPSAAPKDSALLKNGCFDKAAFAQLGTLPKGRVVAPIDFGPFVLAFTGHDVLSAPYHRLTFGILDTFEILTDAKTSSAVLARNGIDYVMICSTGGSPDSTGELVEQLRAGHPPAYLEQVAETKGQPLLVFRVKK